MSKMGNVKFFADQLWKEMVPKIDSKFASNVSYSRSQVEMNDMENLRTFADQLWKYMVPKLNAMFSSNVSYFRAQVVSNPGNNMLEVQRPVENGTLTLPCTNAMSGAQTGQQVTVLVMGSLSNAVVVADGKMNFTL